MSHSAVSAGWSFEHASRALEMAAAARAPWSLNNVRMLKRKRRPGALLVPVLDRYCTRNGMVGVTLKTTTSRSRALFLGGDDALSGARSILEAIRMHFPTAFGGMEAYVDRLRNDDRRTGHRLYPLRPRRSSSAK